MKLHEFEKQVRDNEHETIYDDSEGRTIVVVRLLDLYALVNKIMREEKGMFPVQVSIEEFMMRAGQDPDLVGRPVIWTQWPKEKK